MHNNSSASDRNSIRSSISNNREPLQYGYLYVFYEFSDLAPRGGGAGVCPASLASVAHHADVGLTHEA